MPGYQQQTRLSLGTPTAQVPAHAFSNSDPLGPALQQLGDTIAHVDERQKAEKQRQQEEDARTWAGQANADMQLKQFESLQQQKDEARPGAPNFTDNFLKAFDEKTDAVLTMAPDEKSGKYLKQHIAALRVRLGEQAISFQESEANSDRVNRHADSIDSWAKVVQQDPGQFEAGMVAINETRPAVPPEQREKLKDYAQAKLTTAAGETALIKDPAAVKEATGKAMGEGGFSGPTGVPWIDAAKPNQIVQWNREATVALERIQTSERGALMSKVKDLQAVAGFAQFGNEDPSLAFSGLTKDRFVKAFGAVDGPQAYHREVELYVDQMHASWQMAKMSAADRAKVLESARPKDSEYGTDKVRVYENLVHANQTIEQGLKADSAGYVTASSPRVSSTKDAFQEAVRSGDANAAKLFDTYATESLAEQRRMGVAKPQLLTTGEADSIVSTFMDSPPGQAAQLVQQLEKGYGKRFPEVYQQLARTGKLTPAALVIPNMKDPGSRERMASASGIKTEELATLIPQADRNDLKAKLQDQFKAGAQSFIAQSPKGLGLVSVVMDQAEKLATVYRSQGKSIGDAAKQAYDETMGWKYDFQSTYRTPRYDVAGAPIDTNLVQLGAGKALADMQGVKTFVSPYPMHPEQLVEQTEDAVRANGFWVTNEDETGLELRIKGQDNSSPVVRRQDGSKVTVPFRDLEKLARDALTEEQRQAAEARAAAAKRLGGH